MNNMNGKDFYNALVSGICKVISRHEHLNKINVFPVPDGDTGTNLLFTLRPVIKIKDDIPKHLGEAISLIANTCIDSARGNSGTIMAQYFVGTSETCLDHETISNKNLKEFLRTAVGPSSLRNDTTQVASSRVFDTSDTSALSGPMPSRRSKWPFSSSSKNVRSVRA